MKRKHVIVLSVFIVLILLLGIVTPIVIHCLYNTEKNSAIWITKWSAGEILQYCGTIIAGILTIVGVFVSIMFAQNNYRDDLQKKVLPYFSPEVIKVTKSELLRNSNENELHYNNKIFYIVNNDKIVTTTKMDLNVRNTLTECGIVKHNTEGNISITKGKNLLVAVSIENAGNGIAIGFNCLMKKQSESIKSDYILPINIKTNEKFPIYIIFLDYKNLPDDEYYLSFEYSDIYHNNYYQKLPFIIKENKISSCAIMEQKRD